MVELLEKKKLSICILSAVTICYLKSLSNFFFPLPEIPSCLLHLSRAFPTLLLKLLCVFVPVCSPWVLAAGLVPWGKLCLLPAALWGLMLSAWEFAEAWVRFQEAVSIAGNALPCFVWVRSRRKKKVCSVVFSS